jgi:hypothetical protein
VAIEIAYLTVCGQLLLSATKGLKRRDESRFFSGPDTRLGKVQDRNWLVWLALQAQLVGATLALRSTYTSFRS